MGAAGALALASVAVAVLFVGREQDEWFARVNGVEITRAELVDVLRAEQIDAALAGTPFDATLEAFDAAARLTDSEALRQTAHELGVAVSAEAIEAELVAQLAPELGSGGLDDAGRSLFEERRRQYADLRRLSFAQLDRLVEGELLRRYAAQALGRDIPDPQPQARLHALVVGDLESAERARSDAMRGVSFEELARRYAVDGAAVDLGWLPYGALPPAAAELLWELRELELSPPFLQENQAIVLYVVSAREASRELDAAVRQALEERALESWLRSARDSLEIEARLDSETLAWALEQLEQTPAVRPAG